VTVQLTLLIEWRTTIPKKRKDENRDAIKAGRKQRKKAKKEMMKTMAMNISSITDYLDE
jgi:hypothetical protein